jgi:hypothetical protein
VTAGRTRAGGRSDTAREENRRRLRHDASRLGAGGNGRRTEKIRSPDQAAGLLNRRARCQQTAVCRVLIQRPVVTRPHLAAFGGTHLVLDDPAKLGHRDCTRYSDIETSHETDMECRGYRLYLDAERVRAGVRGERPVDTVENAAASHTTGPRFDARGGWAETLRAPGGRSDWLRWFVAG